MVHMMTRMMMMVGQNKAVHLEFRQKQVIKAIKPLGQIESI